MNEAKCDAWHDGHDCGQPGACGRALGAMAARADARSAPKSAIFTVQYPNGTRREIRDLGY